MSIKLLMLRTGEEIISTVQEIVEPETEKPIGFHLHKPFRLDIVDSNQGQGYQLEWFPWAPLSKDKDFFLKTKFSQPYFFAIAKYLFESLEKIILDIFFNFFANLIEYPIR